MRNVVEEPGNADCMENPPSFHTWVYTKATAKAQYQSRDLM